MPDMEDERIFAAGPDPATPGTAPATGIAAWARRHRKALRRCALAAQAWWRRHRRASLWVGATALALWFFWYPMDRAELFYALPERTAAAAYVRNLAMEDRALLRNPSFQHLLRALGEDPEDAIDDNAGVFWTLYWLTGENSVVGVVPEEGECAGLDGYLAGASYVGWKARALELLWRIKWVPGLGPLRTTAKGTRYMEFPHARELRDNGIVLGLDIVDGVLVAVLAQDPDRVAELAARVAGKTDSSQHLARCFVASSEWWQVGKTAPPLEPWREIRRRHRFWVIPDELGPYSFDCGAFTVDLESFSRPGLEADVWHPGFDRYRYIEEEDGIVRRETIWPTLGEVPALAGAAARAPADAAFLLAAAPCAAGATNLIDGLPPFGGGTAVAWAADRPNATHLAILEVPSVAASLPSDSSAGPLAQWWPAFFERLKSAADLRLRDGAPDPVVRLVRAKKLELLGKTPDADCAFAAEDAAAGRLDLGLGWGAWRTLAGGAGEGRETVGDVVAAWRGAHPATVFALRADMPRVAAQARTVQALFGFAAKFGLTLDPESDETLRTVVLALDAAAGLGRVEVVVEAPDEGPAAVRLRADGAAPER
jgi:hypothetical protein